MVTVTSEEEIFRSCRIIFGENLKFSHDFLQYLQLSGIKKAYRQKALELHPDRSGFQSLAMQQRMANQFIQVHQAYEKLVAYLEARDKSLHPSISAASSATIKQKGEVKSSYQGSHYRTGCNQNRTTAFQKKNGNGQEVRPVFNGPPLDPKSLYKGPLPNCQLLFGRYLYYSGLISLHTIGQALVWQRSQRPCFGEIGRRMGWLNEKDTVKILQQRRTGQLFGESALRMGILTEEQLQSILLHQKKTHKRIGQYFVAKNFWDVVMLQEYVAAHRSHNSKMQNFFA